MIRLFSILTLTITGFVAAPDAADADTAALLNHAQPSIGYPKRPQNTDAIQRRADEIVAIYNFISNSGDLESKAFAVSIMSRNGALARGVKAGKGYSY